MNLTPKKILRVLHLSPSYFSAESVIGGGERYAFELAKAQASLCETVFLSFAPKSSLRQEGRLQVVHLNRGIFFSGQTLAANPFSFSFIRWIHWADVIHCYQAHTLSTNFAILFGKMFRKKVFLTDLGAGHRYAPSYYFPILNKADAGLFISEYSRKLWSQARAKDRSQTLEVIYGGVSEEKFYPASESPQNYALFVGRLLPHKGIDYLIDAVDKNIRLDIVGKVYREDYYQLLRTKSAGKEVHFHPNVNDQELIQKYQRALVTVLPSVYKNYYGEETLVPELLGLTVLESLACGTPVIVSHVASLPEIVQDGMTGFIVPPNDPAALREKILYLRHHPDEARAMGRRGREEVLKRFTWQTVAKNCLKIYQNFLTPVRLNS